MDLGYGTSHEQADQIKLDPDKSRDSRGPKPLHQSSTCLDRKPREAIGGFKDNNSLDGDPKRACESQLLNPSFCRT